MTKLWKTIAGAAVLVGATTLVTTQVVSQDTDPSGDMPPGMQEAMIRMEAWMKYGEPGPEHATMNGTTGTWHNRNTMWMYPGADPMTSQAVSRVQSVMGGRFIVEESSGVMEFMGQSHVFEGMGIYGYDNYREKHFFIWFDSFSTMPMWGEGKENDDGTIVYYSKLPDPVTGEDIEYKSTSRMMSDGKHHFTMYEKKDGAWWQHMEMVGTRQ